MFAKFTTKPKPGRCFKISFSKIDIIEFRIFLESFYFFLSEMTQCRLCEVLYSHPRRRLIIDTVNRILLAFNTVKFKTALKRVDFDFWFEYVECIVDYFKAEKIPIVGNDIHCHVSSCVTYNYVFLSPELPPVKLDTGIRSIVPWLTNVYLKF